MMLNYKPRWQSVKYCPNLVGAAYSAREMVRRLLCLAGL